jgi:Phage integrase family/CHC2 zinc finger
VEAATLRAALSQAEEWELVDRNVAKLVKLPRAQKYKPTFLSPEQAKAFLLFTADHRQEALFSVALSLGLRRGEIVGLRWQDIDFAAGMLRVTHSLERIKGSGLQLGDPKSAKAQRLLYETRHPGQKIGTPAKASVKCIFHDDRTPSCTLFLDGAVGFHCNGCGAGGNVFQFEARFSGCTLAEPKRKLPSSPVRKQALDRSRSWGQSWRLLVLPRRAFRPHSSSRKRGRRTNRRPFQLGPMGARIHRRTLRRSGRTYRRYHPECLSC